MILPISDQRRKTSYNINLHDSNHPFTQICLRMVTSSVLSFWEPFPPNFGDSHPLLLTHHLTRSDARRLIGLLEHLTAVFALEVERGLTYPQEGEIDQPDFESYFFAADVFVGIVGYHPRGDRGEAEIELDIDAARAGRPWDECVAGFYYVRSIIWRCEMAEAAIHRSNLTTLDARRM
jgi:hypothetical protein